MAIFHSILLLLAPWGWIGVHGRAAVARFCLPRPARPVLRALAGPIAAIAQGPP